MKILLVVIALFGGISSFFLYCCMRVASKEDALLEKMVEERGKKNNGSA